MSQTTVEDGVFVEKYRPETLDDIIGHDVIIETLQSYVDDPTCPNLLFAGPQGSGKTSIVMAFAREKFGDAYKQNVMEMNASDDRGIDVVRNQIKNFAMQGTTASQDYKILFLDEADSLTSDAQNALRRTIEQYQDTTRFFLSCNYPNQIIQPIQSRCAPFRIDTLGDGEIYEVVQRVVEGEDIDVSDEELKKIVKNARGDARKAIQSLQIVTMDGEVNPRSVEAIIGVINDEELREIVDLARCGQLHEAMERVQVDVLKQGATSRELASGFLRVLKNHEDMTADERVKCIHKLADKEHRTKLGGDPLVQWSAFMADINIAQFLQLDQYAQAQEGGQ